MSAAHTPGPLVRDTRGYPHSDVKAASGRSVANTWGVQSNPAKTAEAYQRRLEEGRGNARRIVACWNACEGVDTDLLEQKPAPFSELRTERDTLAKALTDLIANQDATWVAAGFTDEQIKAMPYLKPARAAIAKVGGAA